jgi:hypothetical protein
VSSIQGVSRVEQIEALKERKKGNRPHVIFYLDFSFSIEKKRKKYPLL